MKKPPVKVKKTVIITGYACNNNCLFCIDSEKRKMPQKTTDQIMHDMVDARQRGTTYLEFIGGEMTIRPDFVELVKQAKQLGFKTIMMATNGRMLSYYKYARQLAGAGLNSVVFSIHGHNAREHDALTRSRGSFEQLMAGLANMKKLLGLKKLGTNTTLVKQNYKNAPKIGRLISGLGIRNSEFIFVDCNQGAAHIHFKEIVPRISLAAPYIKKCLDIGKEIEAEHWHIRYVPLCYFEDYLEQISELREVSQFQTEHLAPDFVNFDVERSRPIAGRSKTKKCRQCRLFRQCEGIWKTYYEHYGDKELRPIK